MTSEVRLQKVIQFPPGPLTGQDASPWNLPPRCEGAQISLCRETTWKGPQQTASVNHKCVNKHSDDSDLQPSRPPTETQTLWNKDEPCSLYFDRIFDTQNL